MLDKIETPFTQEQVDNLNSYQLGGSFHPFTCCGGNKNTPNCLRNKSTEDRSNGIDVPYTNETEGILIATEEGWICPCGQYTQKWAHSFMSEKHIDEK